MSWIEVRQHERTELSWWYNEYRRDRIDMQPGYQRRSNLWGRWKKAHLIDSMINGFDVPKIYVADFNKSLTRLQGKQVPFAVIDGKQRFEAMFSFLSGDFALNPSATYLAEPDIAIGGLGIVELRRRYPTIAKRIEHFELVVMAVATDSQEMIEELFVRLNSGVSINGAERRNAMPGPIPPIVRDITVHPFFSEYVRFSKDRMQEFNLAAKLLMIEVAGGFLDTKARNLDAFVLAANDEVAPALRDSLIAQQSGSRRQKAEAQSAYDEVMERYRIAEQRVMETLDAMIGIFDPRDALLAKQGGIPVYYWIVRNRKIPRRSLKEFLGDFEPAVLYGVRKARRDPEGVDSRLLTYYNAARTSNDKSSMEQRYGMLQELFVEWRDGELEFENS